MNAANGVTEYVRTVSTFDGLDVIQPMPGLNNNLADLLGFAHQLRERGLDLGPRIEKIEAVWDAARTALDFSVFEAVGQIDIDTVDVKDVASIVSQAAISHTAHLRTSFYDAAQDSGVSTTLAAFDRALTARAGELLRENADTMVTALRKDFDAALKVIAAAHKQGITTTTQRDELLDQGTPAAITAYRALPAAVTTLDTIARVRLDMERHLGYRPTIAGQDQGLYDIAVFLADASDSLAYAGAELAWEGETEHVQVDAGILAGSSIHKTRKPRVGGRWLELVNRGHKLHLNTAAETAKIIVSARKEAA